jgi:uncharacterized membrane protein YphA (DoxX/SURF4 family)
LDPYQEDRPIHEGVPLPYVAVWISVIVEGGAGIALILDFLTRPLAVLLALYTAVRGYRSSFLDDVWNGASRS